VGCQQSEYADVELPPMDE
jgi:hypothetical protein